MVPARLIAAAVIRDAACSVDDGLRRAGWIAVKPLDLLRAGIGHVRGRFVDFHYRTIARGFDAALAFSGVVAGCGCDGNTEDECQRDCTDRAQRPCSCSCHAVLGQVLPS